MYLHYVTLRSQRLFNTFSYHVWLWLAGQTFEKMKMAVMAAILDVKSEKIFYIFRFMAFF